MTYLQGVFVISVNRLTELILMFRLSALNNFFLLNNSLYTACGVLLFTGEVKPGTSILGMVIAFVPLAVLKILSAKSVQLKCSMSYKMLFR